MPRTGWEDKSEKEKLISSIMHTTRMPPEVLAKNEELVAELAADARELCNLVREENEE